MSGDGAVREQYEAYPYPARDPGDEAGRLITGSPSHILEIEHFVLAGGRADICVLARAHLYDPYYARHAARAMGYDLPLPAQYRSIEDWEPRLTD